MGKAHANLNLCNHGAMYHNHIRERDGTAQQFLVEFNVHN